MNKIVELIYENNYELWMRFNDGASQTIDFKTLIGKGISSKLLDVDYFKLAKIDNGGGIEWPNGFDFCPNYLRENMNSKE